MKVDGRQDGFYVVADDELTLAGPFPSNDQAWRWIDEAAMEPKTRREHLQDWVWKKGLD